MKVADLALIFRNAETHDPTAHTRPRGCEAAPAMAAMGPVCVKTPNLVFSLGVRGDRDEAFC